MQITYPIKEEYVAELLIDGNTVKYKIPPATGTHQEVFQKLAADKRVKTAQGKEIVAYAYGALVYKKNEWADQERIRFPSKNYLRFPAVLTIIPKSREFGDLEGGMLIDSDLDGEGIEKQIDIPKDLSGWKVSDGGILINDNRIFLPYNNWYKDQWDETNGVPIALSGGIEGAEALARTAKDSGRNYKHLWKVNPSEISSPEKRVPILNGYFVGGLNLSCSDHGSNRGGCAAGVLY